LGLIAPRALVGSEFWETFAAHFLACDTHLHDIVGVETPGESRGVAKATKSLALFSCFTGKIVDRLLFAS
jgi:hypothetical protein